MNGDGLKLALVSTPRSGNTWLRHMLAASLDLHEIAVHNPYAVDWGALPARTILQTHWLPDEALEALFQEHGCRVVVIGRHPLGVLVSLLAYVQHGRETGGWLDGLAGDERDLDGASPLDASFLNYATGARACALLNVGVEWWSAPGAVRVRYEDLVDDTHGQLSRVLAELDVQTRRPLAEIISRSTPDHLRSASVDLHFHVWQARPGLWRGLLPAVEARRIFQAQQAAFQTLGYPCDPDESLGQIEAREAWQHLELASIKRNLFGLKQKMNEAEARRFTEVQRLSSEFQSRLAERDARAPQADERQAAELRWLRGEVESLQRQLAAMPLQHIRDLAPWSLGVASALHRGLQSWSRVTAGIKTLALFCRRSLSWTRASRSDQESSPH